MSSDENDAKNELLRLSQQGKNKKNKQNVNKRNKRQLQEERKEKRKKAVARKRFREGLVPNWLGLLLRWRRWMFLPIILLCLGVTVVLNLQLCAGWADICQPRDRGFMSVFSDTQPKIPYAILIMIFCFVFVLVALFTFMRWLTSYFNQVEQKKLHALPIGFDTEQYCNLFRLDKSSVALQVDVLLQNAPDKEFQIVVTGVAQNFDTGLSVKVHGKRLRFDFQPFEVIQHYHHRGSWVEYEYSLIHAKITRFIKNVLLPIHNAHPLVKTIIRYR